MYNETLYRYKLLLPLRQGDEACNALRPLVFAVSCLACVLHFGMQFCILQQLVSSNPAYSLFGAQCIFLSVGLPYRLFLLSDLTIMLSMAVDEGRTLCESMTRKYEVDFSWLLLCVAWLTFCI